MKICKFEILNGFMISHKPINVVKFKYKHEIAEKT